MLKACSTENLLSFVFSPYHEKDSGMLHHGSMRRVHSKQCYLYLHIYFPWHFCCCCCCFSSKTCVFIIFISFFDKASNFRNRILTNQKPESVIKNYQWNFMLKTICEWLLLLFPSSTLFWSCIRSCMSKTHFNVC